MSFSTFGKSPAFGQPAQQPTSAFGGFGGAPATTSAPSAFNFGTTARTTAPTFGFGAGTTPSFGTAPATTSSFSFGTALGGTAAPTAFTSIAPATTSTFSFGPTTTTTSAFNFGLGAGTTAPAFGQVAPQPQASGFSFGNAPSAFGNTGTSLFGGLNTTTSFANPLGTTLATSAAASAPSAAQQALTTIATALSLPILYGDERDPIIARWNQLQAFWGVGKGFYAVNAAPVEFTSDNHFSRFKYIGYSRIPQYNPEDGFVGLDFNKKDTEILNQKQQIIEALQRLFGNKPNLAVCIEGIKTLINEKIEVIIYVVEKTATGLTHRIPAPEVLNFLQQPNIKQQLLTMGIEQIVPKTSFTKEHLQIYLDNPPAGIDTILWRQAKLDNPNPDQFIPVPIIGFNGLLNRLKCQQQETKQHQERLLIIGEDIADLKRQHTTTDAKIAETKRKLMELGQRLLKVMVKQEINRKMGFALHPEEEQLQNQLEIVQSQLDSPTQYRGRLKELLSQIRLHNHRVAFKGENEKYKLSPNQYQDIKQHLQYQSEGINYLINILKDDLKTLGIVEGILKDNADRNRR